MDILGAAADVGANSLHLDLGVLTASRGSFVSAASENPYRWKGIKNKAGYASSELPPFGARIETERDRAQEEDVPPLPPRKELIQPLEPRGPYLETIEKLVDWQRLRDAKFRFLCDPMHGSAAGLLWELFTRNGVACDEIRGTRDPDRKSTRLNSSH